jgi:hypothetical protein
MPIVKQTDDRRYSSVFRVDFVLGKRLWDANSYYQPSDSLTSHRFYNFLSIIGDVFVRNAASASRVYLFLTEKTPEDSEQGRFGFFIMGVAHVPAGGNALTSRRRCTSG